MSEPRPPEPQHRAGWGSASDGFRFNDGSAASTAATGPTSPQPAVPPPAGWGPATWSPIPQQGGPAADPGGGAPQLAPPSGGLGQVGYPPGGLGQVGYPAGGPGQVDYAAGGLGQVDYPAGGLGQVDYPAGGPGQVGYPSGSPPPAWTAPAPYARPRVPAVVSAMPDGERTYPQMLRGPRQRWWRPLLALVIGLGIALAAQFLAVIPFLAFGAVATRGRNFGQWITDELDKLSSLQIDAAGFFLVNLTLIALIPAAGLSIWAAHHIRPRFVSSVVGGFRWRWLLRCLLVVVPLWAFYIVASVLVDRPSSDRPAEWVLLLVLVIVMTPLQAAGEEYFFRGWILQNVGSWFKRPILSLVSGTVVSAVAFSAAHGSPDPWILGSLAIFAISCCVLTWRTGGLEAAIAIHAVNNIAAFVAVINFGGWDEAFIGADTKGDPAQFAIDAVVQVIAFALIWWQAKRTRIRSTYRPAELVAPLAGAPMLSAPSGRAG